MMMQYAEVSVNSPVGRRGTFSYSLPENLNILPGQAVWVPFGDKTLQGIVLELTARPAVAETREILGIIDPRPLLSPVHIALSRWISSYYLSPLFDAVALMLPPGFERRVITYLTLNPDNILPDFQSQPEAEEVIKALRDHPKIKLKDLEKICGAGRVRKVLPFLIRCKLVLRSYELEPLRIRPRMMRYVSLKTGVAPIAPRSEQQSAVLEYLSLQLHPVALSELKQKTRCSSQTVRTLVSRGLLEIQERQVDRDPLASRSVNLSFPLSLTPAQKNVLDAVNGTLHRENQGSAQSRVFLLHGVTGSGKTELYIQALEQVIKEGRRGLVLVPEIALTPQMIERFVSRFPGRVAVLHSKLTLGERFDEWWRIKNGEFAVVIGSRSAVFAPQPDLGLIIIDEEHEWTYKQEDNSPRYHTREVALKLAELTGSSVVLGSATPDVESYFAARNGRYRLLELNERVTPGEGSSLPPVEVVDLRSELKSGNLSLFSRSLHSAIESALHNHEQVLLFLNRRGAASFVECRSCGWVVRCKGCDIPLSYHFQEDDSGILVCHQCNRRIPSPGVCPLCGSRKIKFLGVGTEKLEQETALLFPQARILRWDSDTVRKKGQSHQEIFQKMQAGEADILIGTQMIAKGLDFPGVTLVGVVSADIALNLPHFRAGERTFQLLSQVAGRAGRGVAGGKVIIQTYSPQHYAIQAAARHDYVSFFKKEIAYRHELHYPPFSRLALLVFSHSNESFCQEEAARMKQLLSREKDSQGIAGLSLIGPAPAYVHRLRGKYRWQLILRAQDPSAFLSNIQIPKGWSVDIDPAGLL